MPKNFCHCWLTHGEIVEIYDVELLCLVVGGPQHNDAWGHQHNVLQGPLIKKKSKFVLGNESIVSIYCAIANQQSIFQSIPTY